MSGVMQAIRERRVGSARPARLVMAAAAAVAFAIMGDSLMYGVLPLAAPGLGIGPEQVGLLLSANRLVRLFSNTWLSALFVRFGPYRSFVGAAILGVMATALYGAGWGFVVFLVARLGWGVAWSGLRQGVYQSVWTASAGQAGRWMGLSMGIVRGGSAVSVLIGGYLYDRFGYPMTVGVIVALSALAVPIAFSLRWPEDGAAQRSQRPSQTVGLVRGWREALVTPVQRALLVTGFLKLFLNSVLIATVSLFLARRFGDGSGLLFGIGVGTLAGIVLATRWLSDLVMGPLFGSLSDHLGQVRLATFLTVFLCVSLGVAVTSSGLLSLVALLLVLTISTGVHVAIDAAANRQARETTQPELFVGVYTTASDMGSAAGPLLAFPLVEAVGFGPVYGTAAALVLLAMVYLAWQGRRDVKRKT